MSIWFKALIVFVWLSVPVAGSWLVRSSYQRYLAECLIQRQDCQDRGKFLATYSSAYLGLANRAQQIIGQSNHHTWVRDYRAVEQKEQSAAAVLRQHEPIHFPTADKELGVLEAQLRELGTNAKEAAYYQLDYINAGVRLENLQAVRDDLEKTTYYYKQIGMEGIYLQLNEELAKIENDVRTIRRQRRGYLSMVDDSLSDAASFEKSIEHGLEHLQGKIDLDENQTYRQELHLRLEDFHPLKELFALVSGKDQTP